MNIKITTADNTTAVQQMVEITPDTPTPYQVPLEQYVQQRLDEQKMLQARLNKIQAELDAVTNAGGDVTAISQKMNQINITK